MHGKQDQIYGFAVIYLPFRSLISPLLRRLVTGSVKSGAQPWLLGAAVMLGSAPGLAQAGAKDAEASKLNEDAIFSDYLTTEFGAAQEKLVKALELCGTDGCSSPVIARIHRDLGVVLIAGLGDVENGKVELLLALQAQPNIELDKDLATPEVQKAFDEAKAQAQAGGAPPAGTAAPAQAQAAPQPATGQQPAAPAAAGQPAKPAAPPAGAAAGVSDADLCPPDFPGCDEAGGFENSFCDAASPCPEGYECEDNACHEVEVALDAPQRLNWVSLAVQQDFLFLTKTENLCSGEDYYCFRQGTEQYYDGDPRPNESNRLASGGFRLATTRLLVGFDRALTSMISVGARAGFAFRGGPAATGGNDFVPLHAEARGTLWFGQGVFNKVGLRPFVFLGGGMAQVDAKVSPIYVNDEAQGQLTLDAWRKTGLTFVSLGGGAGYAINPALVPLAEVKIMQMLGAAGTAAAVQLGAAYGF